MWIKVCGTFEVSAVGTWMSEMTSSSLVLPADGADSSRLTALLHRAATGRDTQAWSDLWTELYHNGSLDVSHPLVLPALTDMVEGDDADTAAAALHLAGALLVQADQRYETRELRHQHAPTSHACWPLRTGCGRPPLTRTTTATCLRRS
ncbi:hypothetical protein ABT317_09730 [Streptomyces carpinensis]|uniref:Uncharacterized protein n=1 Tax=Streptomyces carpinensis TaxID=66369 RepID=A0ABV1VZD3_9ACTN